MSGSGQCRLGGGWSSNDGGALNLLGYFFVVGCDLVEVFIILGRLKRFVGQYFIHFFSAVGSLITTFLVCFFLIGSWMWLLPPSPLKP